MKKFFVTKEQFRVLSDAYDKTLGTREWCKYACALSVKCNNGSWKHTVYAAPVFNKGYFKRIGNDSYIYNVDGTERFLLNDECKNLLIPTML